MLALPALSSVRHAFPEAHLLGMARPDHVELVRRIPALDEVVEAAPQSCSERYRTIWRSARTLRDANLDLAVLFATSFEAALTVWMAGVPVRLGHDTDHRTVLLNRVVEAGNQHRADGFQELVSELGAKPAKSTDALQCTSSDRAYADRLFQNAGIGADAEPVFINPASAKKPRAWSSARYRQLAEEISERHTGVPVLVHSRYPCDARTVWSSDSIHAVSDTSLVELAAVMERCCLYVGNDSGPMHIAAALGVPTIGIYGPSSPQRTSPRGASGAAHIAVSASFACSPCRERFFEECPSPPSLDERPPCLNEISVESVTEAMERFLSDA